MGRQARVQIICNTLSPRYLPPKPDYVFDSHNMYILYLISFSASHEESPRPSFSSSCPLAHPEPGRRSCEGGGSAAAACFHGVLTGQRKKGRGLGLGLGFARPCTRAGWGEGPANGADESMYTMYGIRIDTALYGRSLESGAAECTTWVPSSNRKPFWFTPPVFTFTGV